MTRPLRALVLALSCSALVVLLLTACSSTTGATPSDSDGGDGTCCPIATPPLSCSGYALGGSRAKNPTCGIPHDDVPAPSRRSVDADGCPIWEYGGAPLADVAYTCNSPRLDASADVASDAAHD